MKFDFSVTALPKPEPIPYLRSAYSPLSPFSKEWWSYTDSIFNSYYIDGDVPFNGIKIVADIDIFDEDSIEIELTYAHKIKREPIVLAKLDPEKPADFNYGETISASLEWGVSFGDTDVTKNSIFARRLITEIKNKELNFFVMNNPDRTAEMVQIYSEFLGGIKKYIDYLIEQRKKEQERIEFEAWLNSRQFVTAMFDESIADHAAFIRYQSVVNQG